MVFTMREIIVRQTLPNFRKYDPKSVDFFREVWQNFCSFFIKPFHDFQGRV